MAGETPSLTGEFIGETHRVLECTPNHPPRNQQENGPIFLWVAEEVTESQPTAEQVALFLLRLLPNMQQHGFPCSGKYLRLLPLQHNRHAKARKYGPSERTDQNSRNNTIK